VAEIILYLEIIHYSEIILYLIK